MKNQEVYKQYLDSYIKDIFEIEVDIRFWKDFLALSIANYKAKNPVNRWISQSGFSVYNSSPTGKSSWLYVSEKTSIIEIQDLSQLSENFFNWVMNMALIRVYNSLEQLLLRTIKEKHFPSLPDPLSGKKHANKVIFKVKEFLENKGLECDKTNNRYLIKFLKENSQEATIFCASKVNKKNWQATTWENFFELVSILRNINAHHSMLVSVNTRNTINSIAGDIFQHYFIKPDKTNNPHILSPKDEKYFLNFLGHISDFAVNIVKFAVGQSDLNFLGLKPA